MPTSFLSVTQHLIGLKKSVTLQSSMISMVVAVDENNIIGSEQKVPWRIRSDLKNLVRLTKNQVVILGRKTYDSMSEYYDRSGNTMPGGLYVILTRDKHYIPSRKFSVVVYSVDEAVSIAESFEELNTLVIGGAEIYRQMLPYSDKIYLTKVHTNASGDIKFPEIDYHKWNIISKIKRGRNPEKQDEHDFEWIELERA